MSHVARRLGVIVAPVHPEGGAVDSRIASI